MITDSFLEEFETHTLKHAGNTNLKILLYDPSENISVDLFSRSQHIELTDELLKFLSASHEIEFKLF
jgi:hypothetical protein